jgi:proto-oncogene C-crk
VRKSPNHPDDYVLSVSENGRVSQYIVKKQAEDCYTIGDQSFTDIPQLLEFYKVHYLDTTTLFSPVEKAERPPLGNSISVDLSFEKNSIRMSKTLVKALYDFEGKDDEDLPFRKGDILEITNKQEEQWWTAKNDAGRQGSIPVNYVQAFTNRGSSGSPNTSRPPSLPNLPDPNRKVFARVIMRRVPNAYDPEALPLEIGDIVAVTRRNVSGQWEGMINGRTGHFPFTHVKIVDASELQ